MWKGAPHFNRLVIFVNFFKTWKCILIALISAVEKVLCMCGFVFRISVDWDVEKEI